jgi:preprotein translocase subunit SecA
METEKQRILADHYARRLAEIKAVDMHALSDEALRGKAEEFRKRLLEAKAQKTA